MNKVISTAILSLLLSVLPVRSSNATIGIYTAFFSPAAASKLALTGLATISVGYAGSYVMKKTLCDGEKGCLAPMVAGWIIGMIFLNEESGVAEFKKIDLSTAQDLGLSAVEVDSYNSEIEEVNAVFTEVIAELDKNSSDEDAAQVWEEYEAFLSPNTFKVMKALATPQVD